MKNWIIPILLCVIVGITFLIQRNTSNNLRNELIAVQLTSGNLAADVVSLSTFSNNMLTKISRINGSDTTIVETVYIPVETEVVTTVVVNEEALTQLYEAQTLLDSLVEVSNVENADMIDSLRVIVQNLKRNLHISEITFDNSGFCTEPCVVGGVNFSISPVYGVGARLLYIGRFGAGLQATIDKEENGALDIFGDWRIPGRESIAPYGSFGRNFGKKEWQFGVGAHLYF